MVSSGISIDRRPHHRRVWERMIRASRKIRQSLFKEQTLDDQSPQTLMCETKSIIDDRPLTVTGSSIVITPGSFYSFYSRRRWLQVQYLVNVFWYTWKREYLPLLQERRKWLRPRRSFSVRDIVIIVDGQSPRDLRLVESVMFTLIAAVLFDVSRSYQRSRRRNHLVY